jgi:uncharacterized protein (TIGR03086 family)
MSEEMLSALDEINANANRLVASIESSQWENATPCSEWDVRALVNHMTGTTKLFGASALRAAPDAAPDAEHLGDDPTAAFASATAAASAAWRSNGALEGSVTIPADMPAVACLGINIIDIGTHTWDLATAIGADHGLSPSTIAMIDQWNRQVVSDDVRAGGGFGEVLEPTTDESLTSMLAFVGRRG